MAPGSELPSCTRSKARPGIAERLLLCGLQGVTDAATLQELLRKRGATRSAAVALQLAVDAFSGGIAWCDAAQESTA